MATTLDEVCDLFLSLQQDYKLTALYQTSGSATFLTYLEPWLLYSIDEFDGICTQSLTYSTTTQSFTETLTQKNKNVLAQLMVRYWLQKEVQDVLQMRVNLQDRDYKHYSEAQNLKEKRELLNVKREEISQLLLDYGYKNNDWASWELQDFA